MLPDHQQRSYRLAALMQYSVTSIPMVCALLYCKKRCVSTDHFLLFRGEMCSSSGQRTNFSASYNSSSSNNQNTIHIRSHHEDQLSFSPNHAKSTWHHCYDTIDGWPWSHFPIPDAFLLDKGNSILLVHESITSKRALGKKHWNNSINCVHQQPSASWFSSCINIS